jgi:hypothetical protein
LKINLHAALVYVLPDIKTEQPIERRDLVLKPLAALDGRAPPLG